MPELQIRLGIFSKDYNALTQEESDFLDYFIMIRSFQASRTIFAFSNKV